MKTPSVWRAGSIALWALVLIPGLWLADSRAQDVSSDGSGFVTPPNPKPKRSRKPKPAPAPGPVENEPPGEGAAGRCGVERWAVKTLSDAGVDKVDFNSVVDAGSVSDLSNMPGQPVWQNYDPSKGQLPPDVRITGPEDKGYAGADSLETSVIRVRGNLICYKLEADHDYHVVIADPSLPPDQIPDCNHWPQSGPIRGLTMIVEIPDPSCPGASQSEFRGQFAQARQQLQQLVASMRQPQPSDQFVETNPPIPVVVRGVRFFDPYHKQSGVSKYGLELHPVLCIKGAAQLGSGSECDPY